MKFTVYVADIFQSDCCIIFKHTYMHGRITGTLAFCVVVYMRDAQMGISDFLLVMIKKFILITGDWNIRGIICREHIIDQRDNEFWHFCDHSAKDIIKDGAVGICQKDLPFL